MPETYTGRRSLLAVAIIPNKNSIGLKKGNTPRGDDAQRPKLVHFFNPIEFLSGMITKRLRQVFQENTNNNLVTVINNVLVDFSNRSLGVSSRNAVTFVIASSTLLVEYAMTFVSLMSILPWYVGPNVC